MARTRKQQEETRAAIEQLRDVLTKGQKVYTVLRHVSSSGMSRAISALIIHQEKDGKPELWDISYLVARALEWSMHDKGGVKVAGCGMDMGFHLVHTLSSVLWGWNEDGSYSSEGAYALKHEWL